MAQIKIYGVDTHLNAVKPALSEVIHKCIVETLKLPIQKRFHRFFPMKKEDFYFPKDRSDAYTIIEIRMLEGRSMETKKRLIQMLFSQIEKRLGIAPNDVEIVITEAPAHCFGFRGMCADEIVLEYKVEV